MGEVAVDPHIERCSSRVASVLPRTAHVVGVTDDGSEEVREDAVAHGSSGNTQPMTESREAWLPITESRKGNLATAVFHLVCSGVGFQCLLLPVALATLGWY